MARGLRGANSIVSRHGKDREPRTQYREIKYCVKSAGTRDAIATSTHVNIEIELLIILKNRGAIVQ